MTACAKEKVKGGTLVGMAFILDSEPIKRLEEQLKKIRGLADDLEAEICRAKRMSDSIRIVIASDGAECD